MERERKITDTLLEVRGGDLVAELTDAMRDLVKAVLTGGGKGSITLKLNVGSASKGGAQGALVITDDVKVKLPTAEKSGTVLFGLPDGDLQRQDPRQPRLAYEKPGATVTPIAERQEASQ